MPQFIIGQKVTVRPTAPKPPAHHHRKLRDWEFHNYTGEVINCVEDLVYVRNLDASSAIVDFTFWIKLDGKEFIVEPLESEINAES